MSADINTLPSLSQAKSAARRRARAVRAAAHAGANATGLGEAYHRAADHLLTDLDPAPGTIVAVYLAMGHEFDTRPLLKRLVRRQCVTCLPVIAAPDAPLFFRAWKPGDPLEAGPHDIPAPPVSAAPVRPQVVIVPLLAFDAAGHRLGQGGGYYDRTLPALRADGGPLLAVGLGFDCQRVEAVPHDALDVPLDKIVTEARVHIPVKET